MPVQITAEIARLIKGLSLREAPTEKIAAFFQVDVDQVMAVIEGEMFRNVQAALGTELPRLRGTYQMLNVRRHLNKAQSEITAAFRLLDSE